MCGTGLSGFLDLEFSIHRRVSWLTFFSTTVKPTSVSRSPLFKNTALRIEMPEIGRAIRIR